MLKSSFCFSFCEIFVFAEPVSFIIPFTTSLLNRELDLLACSRTLPAYVLACLARLFPRALFFGQSFGIAIDQETLSWNMSVDNQFTICHFKQLDVLTWRLDNIIKCTDKKTTEYYLRSRPSWGKSRNVLCPRLNKFWRIW